MSITVTHVKGPETGSPNKQLHLSNISIPLPAVLGRGALLKCAEKKVSRRHATLDWDDDGVMINSVNQNPTFVSIGGNKQKLSQGESVVLGHGDKFGLLEDAFWFRVTLENTTQSSDKENALMNSIETKSGHDNIKELKCIQENRNDYTNHNNQIIKNKENNIEESNVEEKEIIDNKKEAAKITNKVATGETVSEYIQKNLPHLNSSFTPKDQKNSSEETANAFLTKTKMKVSSPAVSTSKQLFNTVNQEPSTSNNKDDQVSQILYTQKDLDEAVNDRKRTLPAWMSGSAPSTNKAEPSTSNKKEPTNAVQHGRKNVKATPKKENISEVKVDNSINSVDNVEKKKIRKKSPQKSPSKTTPSKYHGMSQNDDDEMIGVNAIIEREEKYVKNKSPTKRSPKASPSKKTPSKYHGLSQELNDEETSNKDDIEMKNSTTEERHDISDDGSDDNVNSPKKNLPSPRKHKTPDKKYPHSDDNDSDSEVTNKPKITVGNRLAGVATTNDAGSRGRKRAAPRGSCAYGSQCYRKNPQHKDEYAHPGDSDYNEDDDEDDANDDDDDERPECEFGVDCYRKNPQHRKDFKHTRNPQPQRKAKRKAKGKKRGSDESESDDYDLDDSFLCDDSSDEYAPSDSGSDTNIEDNDVEEDTDRMLKEGKKFTKNN